MENGPVSGPEPTPPSSPPLDPRRGAQKRATEWASEARQAMTRYTALWMPPIATNTLQMLTLARPGSALAQGVIAMTAGIAALMIEAGWLEMIGRALKGEPPTMKDFAHGINARWVPIIVGNLAFVLIVSALFGAAFAWGEQQWSSKAVIEWYQALQALPTAEQAAALQPEKLPAAVRGWLNLFMAWVLAASALGLALIAWQPFCVIGRMSWWRAWGASIRLVFKRFPAIFGFGVLQVASLFIALTLGASGQFIGGILGAMMLLMVTIYFKVLYSAAVIDALGGPDAVLTDVERPAPTP